MASVQKLRRYRYALYSTIKTFSQYNWINQKHLFYKPKVSPISTVFFHFLIIYFILISNQWWRSAMMGIFGLILLLLNDKDVMFFGRRAIFAQNAATRFLNEIFCSSRKNQPYTWSLRIFASIMLSVLGKKKFQMVD